MTLAARISGVGRYVPERVMTNEELEATVETSSEWIVERTGISERRIAAPHETTSSMGTEAARRALASAGITGAEIDLVITGTCTPDGLFPATASAIQNAIGANHAGAFDVNAACVGFLSGLATGAQFIATGSAERVLVVGAETLSRIVDWTDRGTCVLFGDGAGAVVLERAVPGEPGSIDSLLLRSDGSQAGLLYSHGPCSPLVDGLQQEAKIVMDGRAVFRQAVTMMCDSAIEVIARAGLTVDDIALAVPHQANMRIITAMSDRLGLPMDRVYVNVDRYGNTSSATIPIALAEAEAEGRLKPGDRVLFASFGGGLSWGAMVIEWAGVGSRRLVTASAARSTGA
ncbi:MAG: beta-ketoacyl-ACP synthase III [Dehalococcoidia bacterium]|nr:beta-ketoacyl-ACP synthase III [Dehalococcoidia bacterium]